MGDEDTQRKLGNRHGLAGGTNCNQKRIRIKMRSKAAVLAFWRMMMWLWLENEVVFV